MQCRKYEANVVTKHERNKEGRKRFPWGCEIIELSKPQAAGLKN